MFDAPMRRSNKQIASREEIDAVLSKAEVLHLAMCQDNQPYVVPLNFGYDGEHIFFHTAQKGLKAEIIKQNPKVCFEAYIKLQINEDPAACKWETDFESVVGFGTAVYLEDEAEKVKGLNAIMKQYDPGVSYTYEAGPLKKVAVVKVEISSMTGKRSPAPKD